ncbi:MAG: alanine racemase [Propionibacteriaceae bacterium]|nr:alanine racemase [Propionibacteriaceae bacterium]
MLYSTRATIHLDALRHNVAALRTLIGDRALMAPLKANAYGHGAVEVAKFLEREALADWIGVTTVPEALELRQAGLRMPLLKLSLSFPDELPALLTNDAAVTVADEPGIDAAEAAATAAGLTAQVHLKIDTGMRRVGCEPADAVAMARRISACQHLNFQGISTHLPISDVADQGFTEAQLTQFKAAVQAIQDARATLELPPVPLIHASNSGGILGHSLDGLTMVRPGIALFGCYPDATTPRTVELRPVMTLTSKVAAVKQVDAGQTVGYGRTWTAPRATWIATVPVGYADGYSRLNSNRGSMLMNGRRYPVAGRVCMDSTMLDLGPGPESPVNVGDTVTWLGTDGGETITADELAGIMGTISYEMFCLLGPRVPRDYLE